MFEWTKEQWLFYTAVWTFVNVSPMWYIIYTNKRSAPNSVRDSGYEPWVRNDYNNWSYPKAIVTHFFIIPRLLLAWVPLIIGVIGTKFIEIGHDKSKPYGPARRYIHDKMCRVLSRINALIAGVVWSTTKRVTADYSKYLGKDYVYRYDRVGIHVANHISCFDVVHHLYLGPTAKSFIGKKEMTSFPLIGSLVKPLESILVGRDTKDSVDERNNAIEAIH